LIRGKISRDELYILTFVDPDTKGDLKPRESIEVRCLVFWDEDVECECWPWLQMLLTASEFDHVFCGAFMLNFLEMSVRSSRLTMVIEG
jgi:hypothetical protein